MGVEIEFDRGFRIVLEGNGDGRRLRCAVNLVRINIDPDVGTIQRRRFGFQVVEVGVATCGHLHCEYVAVDAWGFQRSGDLTGGNSCGFSKEPVVEDLDNRVDVGGAVVDLDFNDARRLADISVVGVGTRRLNLDDWTKRGRLTVNSEPVDLGA